MGLTALTARQVARDAHCVTHPTRIRQVDLVLVFLVVACGSGEATYDVVSEVVGDAATQEILVFAPDADGMWPVVMALHGLGGKGEDMAEMANRLAETGLVVFAPTYRSDMTTAEGVTKMANDSECAYRYAIDAAGDYGGDLGQPLSVVGWSLGASIALEGGLSGDDPLVACSEEVPAPDVVVAISGCHYEFRGNPTSFFDPSRWGNKQAHVVLLGGENDTECAWWQTETAVDELRSNGYTAEQVLLEDTSHFAPVFHDLSDGEWTVVPDDPAGLQAVDAIVDAIHATES
jgi:dienelactone hydrolase